MFLTVLVISCSFMFAQQKGCSKKCAKAGAKCNTMTVDSQVDIADIKCNHAENEKCDPVSCPRAAAEANMQVTTTVVTTTDAAQCNHKKSWWKVWGKKNEDCCKKVTP